MPVYFQILKQENYQDWRLPEKMKYKYIKEEELKNRIAEDYFWQYDHTKIIGNIDFCVAMYQSQKEIFEQQSLPLQKIINNPQKRKKLVVYINPPYAEHLDKKNTTSNKENINKAVLKFTKTNEKYKNKYGSKASRELFVQFFIRIYEEIPDATIASFSKLKYLNSNNFIQFRNLFKADFKKGFMVPANSFDNVKGNFPIGFIIWNTIIKNTFSSLHLDIIDIKKKKQDQKFIYISENIKGSISMNDWIKKYSYSTKNYFIGYLNCSSQDFLHQNYTGITTYNQNSAYKQLQINEKNLIQTGIYFSVSHCIKATWLNDRDQFLFPNDAWEMDEEFKHDCLAFTLFHSQNRISSKEEINHWIPFSESEINAREKFESNFMYLFINNKIKKEVIINLFTLQESETPYEGAMQFSAQATAVFDAGRELWKYYHKQANCNVNASLYDIREHFQGRNTNGRMNSNSNDETYTKLIEDLQEKLKILADKIIPKIYEYGFLKD